MESVVGQGSRFTIHLPLTLAIVRAVLVEAGGGTYVLPLGSVVEMLRLGTADEVRPAADPGRAGGHQSARADDPAGESVRPARAATGQRRGRSGLPRGAFVVVVGVGDRQVGLCVDALVGEQEVVIKSLGTLLGDIPGLSGATILGDGRVALIVDVAKAVNEIGGSLAAAERDRKASAASLEEPEQRTLRQHLRLPELRRRSFRRGRLRRLPAARRGEDRHPARAVQVRPDAPPDRGPGAEGGCASFAAYARAMERDPARLAEFLDRMTINVTELLRNPNRFEELTTCILPEPAGPAPARPFPSGAPAAPTARKPTRWRCCCTRSAPTTPHRIKGPTWIGDSGPSGTALLQPGGHGQHLPGPPAGAFPGDCRRLPAAAAPARHVRFGPHDLLADPYPQAEYDLILCRNVVIYFTDDAKERIYRGFFQALRPGGVLFVGGTERLSDHRAIGFELLRPFFYRKPPSNS